MTLLRPIFEANFDSLNSLELQTCQYMTFHTTIALPVEIKIDLPRSP